MLERNCQWHKNVFFPALQKLVQEKHISVLSEQTTTDLPSSHSLCIHFDKHCLVQARFKAITKGKPNAVCCIEHALTHLSNIYLKYSTFVLDQGHTVGKFASTQDEI